MLALRNLGGSASRKRIREDIADNGYDGFTYEMVNYMKKGRKSTYSPFLFDFNFGIRNLRSAGLIEEPQRGKDVVLTSQGQTDDLSHFPTKEQQREISAYWAKKNHLRMERKKHQNESTTDDETDTEDESESVETTDFEDTENANWKGRLIEQLKKFSPAKFESFSRLLISKMGVKIDKKRGIVLSGDHGLDGFGYFTSDDFRTSRVAIQCKRYDTNAVSEPEIDKFKGVMDGFNAEYGIFITTSHFTEQAKMKATQGNNTVTLIDGQHLADLIEKYQLYITPVQTFTLDDYYFDLD